LGDIIDWKEEKQATKGSGHASVVSNNVLTLVGLKSGFKKYKGAIEMIGLSNGKVCPCLVFVEGIAELFFSAIRMGERCILIFFGGYRLEIGLRG
jgi:hypothetical protein